MIAQSLEGCQLQIRAFRGYLDLAADGIMGRDELKEKLLAIEEVRGTAKRKLKALRSRRERLEELERDKEALLDSYARMTPEALDGLTPEERHRVYGMLGLRAAITMDGALEVSGTFDDGDAFAVRKRATRRHRDQEVRWGAF